MYIQVEKKLNVKELESMVVKLRQELHMKGLERQTAGPSDATKEKMEMMERCVTRAKGQGAHMLRV